VQTPAPQKLLLQSLAAAQVRPVSHGLHFGPPQSMSVSLPFFRWSVHEAGAHLLLTQTPLPQSLPNVQGFPSLHAEHGPPQSTAVSPPLRIESEQDAAWQSEFVQTPLSQSGPVLHAPSTGHPGQLAPPQSTSDSVPSRSAFTQLGSWQVPR
jgi:hypothetical protein